MLYSPPRRLQIVKAQPLCVNRHDETHPHRAVRSGNKSTCKTSNVDSSEGVWLAVAEQLPLSIQPCSRELAELAELALRTSLLHERTVGSKISNPSASHHSILQRSAQAETEDQELQAKNKTIRKTHRPPIPQPPNPHIGHPLKDRRKYYAMPRTTIRAIPSSSALTTAFNATPCLTEYANCMRATTRPPPTVLPKSFSWCVALFSATSLPLRGCM